LSKFRFENNTKVSKSSKNANIFAQFAAARPYFEFIVMGLFRKKKGAYSLTNLGNIIFNIRVCNNLPH